MRRPWRGPRRAPEATQSYTSCTPSSDLAVRPMLADDLHQPIEDRRPAPGARGGEFLRQRLSIRWVTMVNSRLQLRRHCFAISEALLRQRVLTSCERMVEPPSGVPRREEYR